MKRIYRSLFVAILFSSMLTGVQANTLTPAHTRALGWSVSMPVHKIDASALAKAIPLATSSVKTTVTNSQITNSRPSGFELGVAYLSVVRTDGTSNLYYISWVSNGATVAFTLPSQVSVSTATIYHFDDYPFYNNEWGTLAVNGGSSFDGAPATGYDWMDFYLDGTDIPDGVTIVVY